MTEAQAKLKLLALEATTNDFNKLDMIVKFTNLGLSQEVITRIQDLFDFTKKIGNQIIHIGKIIMKKLINFINENPNLTIGLAVGVGLSVLTGMLISAVPVVGVPLSGIVSSIVGMISIPLGILKGHRLDKVMQGEYVSNSVIEDLITVAKKFWALFVDILESLKNILN